MVTKMYFSSEYMNIHLKLNVAMTISRPLTDLGIFGDL